jgi:single-strand DNA-binding protein
MGRMCVECAYWSDRTGVAPYLKKGTQVYVEGTPEIKTYPKKDGTTGASLNLRVVQVQLLGSANRNESMSGGVDYNQGQQTSGYQTRQPASSTASDITEPIDDLPF